ncbi:MAG: DUF58 domain-containing protein, partial [Mycobacterium leprae]
VPTGVLLVPDDQPFAPAAPPRFVVAHLQPGETRELRHHIRPETRGRYPLAPPRARIADPFGLAELTRSFPAPDSLLVTPAVTPLPAVPLGGDWSGGGDSRSRSVAAAGEDDAATRQYRQGDDLRRVHWRSTARYGQLMVRREQPWQNRGALLLDARLAARGGARGGARDDTHGGGRHDDSARRPGGAGVVATFEVAVAATASIGVHLARHGFALRLVTDSGPAIDEVGGSAFEETLLDSLAVVTPSRGRSLVPAVTAVRHGDGAGLVAAVLGMLDLRETEELARLRHGGTECVAVLLDVASWTALPAHAAGEARGQHRAAATLLRGAGWRVVELQAGQRLADRWRHVAVRERT